MSSFIVTNKTINNAVEGYRRYKKSYCLSTVDEAELQQLGQSLFDLNTLAVNGRYNEDTTPPVFKLKVDFERYTSDAQIWKSLKCIDYQCSEEPAIYDPTFQSLQKLQVQFATYYFEKVEGYADAQWDEADKVCA
jgi:hypothetical protein